MEESMFTLVRRVMGWGAVAFALVILGIDVFAMVQRGGAFSAHSIAQDWQLYSNSSYVGFKAWLGHALPPQPASYIAVVLGLWTWAALALAGVLISPFRHASH
jgi:hypothetical protein